MKNGHLVREPLIEMMKMSQVHVKKAIDYSNARRQKLLKNDRLYKFMFVRDPLERLVSAYRNKCFRDPDYMKSLARAIMKPYKPGSKCAGETASYETLLAGVSIEYIDSDLGPVFPQQIISH